MTRGLGERQRKDRLLTTSKIASYLAVRPFTYQELQNISKIQKARLREELDGLVAQKTVIMHRFSKLNDHNLEHRDYYLLNWSKNESQQLLRQYYDDNFLANNGHAVLKKQHNSEEKNFVQTARTDDVSSKINKMRESVITDEGYRNLILSLHKALQEIELDCVKKKIKLNYPEPSKSNIRFSVEAVEYALSRGYSFLDALIKYSADEKIKEFGLCRYSTLWEIMDRTGLLDRYKNEIP